MTAIKLKIMVRACRLRMVAGEALNDILNTYPALTYADREQIRAEITPVLESTPDPAPELEPTLETPAENRTTTPGQK